MAGSKLQAEKKVRALSDLGFGEVLATRMGLQGSPCDDGPDGIDDIDEVLTAVAQFEENVLQL